MRRYRSFKSVKPFPAMEPPEFFIVFIYFTLFSLRHYDGMKIMAEQEGPLLCPIVFSGYP